MVLRLPGSNAFTSSRTLAAIAGLLVVAAVVVVLVLVLGGGGSSSSRTQSLAFHPKTAGALPAVDPHRDNLQTIFTEGSAITQDPAGEIAKLHALGVTRVRVSFTWGSIAPKGTSFKKPHFDATDPNAYPAVNWAPYDAVARDLAADHMTLDLVLAPPPPQWAAGKGIPQDGNPHPYWKPSVHDFEQFVEAVGKRYSGTFKPKGQSTPLPRENFWSIWNEPNIGVMLAPQTQGSQFEFSPTRYRQLADAAWTALRQTGHGNDTTLLGELAPAGAQAPVNFNSMSPLRFLRALYCVGTSFKPLLGAAATDRGCPATAAASGRFRADNPVLFDATDFAAHFYSQGLAPNAVTPDEPDYTELGEVSNLFTTLDRLQEVYGSDKKFDVYDTEFGYQTTPPDTQSGTVSPKQAAKWLNWSEYIHWHYPRILSYDQYLLEDPQPVPHKRQYKGFATGIVTYKGNRKPGWYAFRMPVWLPKTTTSATGTLEVWGTARPAKLVPVDQRPPIQIQFKPKSGGGGWKTVATESTKTSFGYFDIHQKFPASGLVRLRWAPPHGAAMVSRTTPITVG
jgi:hypothetical protein